MASALARDDDAPLPPLRALDVVRVKTSQGMSTMIRDGEGVGETLVVHPPLDQAIELFDGAHSVSRIVKRLSRVTPEAIRTLAQELDRSFLLENDRAAKRRAECIAAFRASPTRPATHAGGAYHGDREQLGRFIDEECLASKPGSSNGGGPLLGLVAPHMDLWRASEGYGHAYAALRDRLAPSVDTFVLLGTCHAGMRTPFSVCRKAFETPLGALASDDDAADALAKASPFDVYADEYQHRGEHSIEFQAVFVRHLIGEARARDARILPILCGLGQSQARGEDPRNDGQAERFVGALAELVASRAGRTVIIGGADLAHVGPRFGDEPLDARGRRALEAQDKASIERALGVDALGFFKHTTADLETRRVCGVGPVYTLLRLMETMGAARGEALHYTQHVDPSEGSIVSHASIAFGG